MAVKKFSQIALSSAQLGPTDYLLGVQGGTNDVLFAQPQVNREVLNAARTYYVRTDGSDSNTGLVDNAGGAFLTIQHAVDVVWDTLDIQNFTVTIQVRSGTYTGAVSKLYPALGGEPVIQGDTTTPSNVVISVTGSDALDFRRGATLTLQGFKVTTATSGHCLHVSGAAQVNISGKMEWGSCAETHIAAEHVGKIAISADYTISGGGLSHIRADTGGHIDCSSSTITLSGTPNFSDAFAVAWGNGSIQVVGPPTFSGSATGIRFKASLNGVINAPATLTFPGNSNGRLFSGGMYGPDPAGFGQFTIIDQSNSNSSITGSTAESQLAAITVPSNSLGINGRMRITTHWSVTNNANTKSVRIRYSSSTGNPYLAGSLTTVEAFKHQCEIYNKGVTNSQEGFSMPSAQGGWGTTTIAIQTSTIDTTADTTLYISGQLSVTTDTITLRSYTVELMYGP